MNRARAFRLWVAVAVVAAAAVAVVVPALGATHTDTSDPNDTDGVFDLAEVALDHYPGPLRWTFRTFGGWSVREVWDRGYLVIALDTRGDDGIDERIVVRSDGEALVATLGTVRSDGEDHVRATLSASKDSRRRASVEVSVRRLLIGRGREAFTWYAYSLFTGSSCQRTCIDLVPDDGRLEQLLPGVSPSPTPTPTPSPTPATGSTSATGPTP